MQSGFRRIYVTVGSVKLIFLAADGQLTVKSPESEEESKEEADMDEMVESAEVPPARSR